MNGPLIIGIGIRKYKPKVGEFIARIYVPVVVSIIIIVSGLVLYINLYIFEFWSDLTFPVSAMLLSYIGQIQSWPDYCKTRKCEHKVVRLV